MRKLLSLTLALLMVFALVPFSAKAVDLDYNKLLEKVKELNQQNPQDRSAQNGEANTAETGENNAGETVQGDKAEDPMAGAELLAAKINLLTAITEAKEARTDVLIAEDSGDVEVGKNWVKQAAWDTFTKAIEAAEKAYDEKTKLEDINEAIETLKKAVEEFKKAIKPGLKSAQPEKKPETTPEVTPQGYVTLTIYRNLNNGDYEYTVKSYAKGTYLYNVNPYGRVGYRVNGYSYSPNGSLINDYTKVEDLVYTTLYADWGYIGEDYYGYGYHRPNSLIYAMDKAKSFKRDYPFQIANVASSALKAEFDAAYNAVSDMYDNSYWGYYYGYYNDGRVYYRNGSWLTYNEYVARYGTYDMENYRRYNYNGRYDGYYRDLYERNGRLYSYNDYRNAFGRYPYDSERVTNRRGYWDAYYGWGGYGYEYYGSNYKARIERLIDAIRAIARQYPGQSIYTDYANLAYPTYSSDYYYGYNYYYGDNYTSDLKNLINKAESLRDRIKGYTTYEILTNLQTCIDDAYRALQGRSNYANAYENLKNAINRADNLDSSIYIRRAYMTGDPSGKFGPYETLTRAQVAQIVANLLKQSGKTTVYNPKQYKDVEAYRWYKEAVDLVTSYGIMTGTPGGLFEPNKLVSKAELVVTAARLKNYQPTVGNVFGLTSHYWAQGYIQTAVKNGWIDVKKGFVPDAPITRGETAHIFNGALGYVADQNYIIKFAPQMKKFNDVERGVDYYYDIMTATNTVSYQYVLGGISWLSHIRPEGMWTMNQYSTGKTIVPLN